MLVKVKLCIISGPQKDKEFVLEGHDTFLVGRAKDAHFQLSSDDPFFSRRHFLIEVNPPRCRVINLSSRNGTLLNGAVVQSAEIGDQDEIRAGNTTFKVVFVPTDLDQSETVDMPAPLEAGEQSILHASSLPKFAGYQIDREIGRGGMGVVYRATREKDGLPVAIKTIRPVVGVGRKPIDRFLREGRILSALDHKNIISFREFGDADGVIYLVMDFVEGDDLGVRLRERGPEPVSKAVRIICQVLSGLAHAHSKGFVHRDIKPSNILLHRDGASRTPKLADFGLARVYEASRISGLTMQGEIGGTPAYMAPEQVTHYRLVKPPADQYAAAATLYKILTGYYIHDLPKDLGASIGMIVSANPVPIIERRSDLPEGLADVIHKALRREPEDRYPDVMCFRKELARFA